MTPDFLTNIHGAEFSRRGFLAVGGALVAVAGVVPGSAKATVSANSLDATSGPSWIEIHADNTVLIRTGKCDFGQSSIYTAYRQIVAEELSLPVEAITAVVSGDTDQTPDGGGTFGLLRGNALNMRKAAAYTREAVLDVAAKRFGVSRSVLTISDGVVSGGGKSARYGELVAGQDLQLTIPVSGDLTGFGGLQVTGNPPLKPASQYKVIGKPIKNPIHRPKMSGEMQWVGDVKLPDMLHARVVHPATLGSTLVSAGKVDTAQFPDAKTVILGNLVGVVAPDEWQAIQAAQQVAGDTKWSEWKGLPGHDKLASHLEKSVDWSEVPARKGVTKGDVAKATSAKTHSASYFMPFFKHAPISPTVSLADVRPDGSVTLHTHSQNPQYLRAGIAKMLGKSEGDVVVRTYPGASHFGRSNGGNAGSECEAVLLSRAVGKPVRVQWMRADDMRWSTSSSAILSKISIGLDAAGQIASYQADHHGPPMQDDRLIGALLAGLPTIEAPGPKNPFPLHNSAMNIADKWLYETVSNVAETGYGTWQLGERESPIHVGLRDHSMRTPIQFQQNFPRETAISEAAALAKADPIQFRLDHMIDERFKAILIRLRAESGWVNRASPSPKASAKGKATVRGQGVSIMLRDNGYWACAAHIAVTPSTGEVKVERITVVVDPGIVVNPLQLRRQVQAGSLMGVSQALKEEVTFDAGVITSEDWGGYPILTMAEMPDIKVVLAGHPGAEGYGQGSESANALAAPAIAAAFFDATGKPARRLPLSPNHVKAILAA